MGHYAGEMDGSPGPNHRTVDKATAWDAISEKNAEIAWLRAELERRTSERDYHIRIAGRLAATVFALTNGE